MNKFLIVSKIGTYYAETKGISSWSARRSMARTFESRQDAIEFAEKKGFIDYKIKPYDDAKENVWQ